MNKEKEYFWSVAIEDGQIQAGIWTIEKDKAKILSIAAPSHWEDKDLIEGADATLSSATQNLTTDEEIEPNKAVFGLPPSWIEEGKIKKEFLEKIKNICDKLSLTPTGFVVLPEAIANFSKSEEGAPLSAVIIGVGEQLLDVSLFRLGNLVGTVNIARSVSIVDDVFEGLARFADINPFPSRFLLYNSNKAKLEDARDQLVKEDLVSEFKDKVKLLHPPQVEIVDPEKKMIAISLAGASEIGQVTKIELDGKEEEEKPEENIQPDTQDEIQKEPEKEIDFSVGEDVSKKPRRKIPLPKLPKINLHIFKNLPKIPMPTQRPVNAIVIFIIILISVSVAAWWFLPKAEVTIYVAPKHLESTKALTYDSSKDSIDSVKGVVPAKVVTKEVSTTKTKQASGTKTIGDRAKGKVTIRNGTSVNINLDAGTVLISSGNLRFLLDSDASISGALSPASPGTATVPATAEAIGADYNVGKSETFKVGNYPKSDVDAIVDTEFTGGSSKDIVAIGKSDPSSLEKSATDELLSDAEKEFQKNLTDSEIYIPESKTGTVESETFDHQVGDEANSLKIDLKLKVTALVVSKDDLNTMAKEYLKDQVPTGFALRAGQVDFNFENGAQMPSNVWQFDTRFIGNLLPEVNIDDISKKITGKYPQVAINYLSAAVPGFTKASISQSINLGGKLSTLPHITKNISIIVSAEK